VLRVMGVSTSVYYQRLAEPVSDAELDEAYRANTVFDIWKLSRHSYGMPRIRREFRQGRHEGISRTTTASCGTAVLWGSTTGDVAAARGPVMGSPATIW